MSDMTSRERMLASIRGEDSGIIPLGQLFHSSVLGTPADKQWSNQFERAAIMRELGIDPVIDIWLPSPEPPSDIPIRKWSEPDPAGTGTLLCAAYETAAGTLCQKVRKTEDWYDRTHYSFMPSWDGNAHRDASRFDAIDMMDDWFTRRYQVPLVRGPEDLDALALLLQAPTEARRDEWIRNARRARAIADDMQLLTQARRVSVGDWFMWACLIEDFCMAMIEAPDYVQRFYDIVQRYNRDVIDMVLEAEPDLIQYRGWYDTPDYWGHDRHQRILVPKIREIADQVHDGGALFCYLLPEGYTHYRDTLKDLDVDVYLGLEPLAARKSEDFPLVKQALGERSCIWGGINAPVHLQLATDAELDAHVRHAVETLGPRRYIMNACMYIYDDDVTWERFMALIAVWRRYARQG